MGDYRKLKSNGEDDYESGSSHKSKSPNSSSPDTSPTVSQGYGAEPVHHFTHDSSNVYVWKICFIAALGGFLFGYDTGVVSGSMLLVEKEFDLSDEAKEMVVGVALGGAVVGALFAGVASDRFGRRPVISLAAFMFLGGALTMTFAHTVSVLIVGRIIVGVAIGTASCLVPVYMAEVSPPSKRGAIVTINNLFITGGQFISFLICYLFFDITYGWRWMLGLSAVPALLQFLGMWTVPESPRWLVGQGRVEEARVVLVEMLGTNNPKDIDSYLESLEIASGEEKGWRDLLDPNLRQALIIGMGLQFFQQFCGINTAMYYSATILKNAGFDDDREATLMSLPVAGTNMIGTIIAIFLIDRYGRRPLLLCSLAGVIIGMCLLGSSYYVDGAWLSLFGLVWYVGFFAFGMGEIPWVVNSEIYPLSVRGSATAVATAVNWGSNWVVSSTILSLFNSVSEAGTFYLYGGMGVLAAVFVYGWVPETKNKSLEDVRITLDEWRNPIFASKK